MRTVLTRGIFSFLCLAVLFAWNSSGVLAYQAIELGCLDCHFENSTIVPNTKQFENGTPWHDLHKSASGGDCSKCHPGSPGSTPIETVNCNNCHHITTCPWQDFHTSNQTYNDNVTGLTCAECHQQCAQPGDADEDGIPDDQDNCPDTPNAGQEDTYPPQGNDIGDACDCEADFNCDSAVDADDVASFLTDFGRSVFLHPCSNADPCNGDFNCDENVDAPDVEKFLEDFGRFQFNNPCPTCVVGDWCSY